LPKQRKDFRDRHHVFELFVPLRGVDGWVRDEETFGPLVTARNDPRLRASLRVVVAQSGKAFLCIAPIGSFSVHL
jgi:hypothetical protein